MGSRRLRAQINSLLKKENYPETEESKEVRITVKQTERVGVDKVLYQEVYVIQELKIERTLIQYIIRQRKSYTMMRRRPRTQFLMRKRKIIGRGLLLRLMRLDYIVKNIFCMASTNKTNFIFENNQFGLYARLFSLINGPCIYIENLPLAVLSM